MLYLLSLIVGLVILLLTAIFIGAVVYHLFQYRLPNVNHRRPIAIIAVLFLVFVFVGVWIFSGMTWENL